MDQLHGLVRYILYILLWLGFLFWVDGFSWVRVRPNIVWFRLKDRPPQSDEQIQEQLIIRTH